MNLISRIAVFASGEGTNAEELFKYFSSHDEIRVVLLLTNNPAAPVLKRAERYGIETISFNREQFLDAQVVLQWLAEKDVSHVVLAGFMWLLPKHLINAFPIRIINIHPALLPRHGGKGMYGLNVHKAVLAAGDTETGITIHLVDEVYDRGRIIYQQKCPVLPTDKPEDIARRVHQLEYAAYPAVVEEWVRRQLP
jgi:phosphoribosylglycinamide formyltransferase-1